jgi:hypothetical protein
MAPVLSEGSQKIGETIEKGARRSGITKEMAESADKFNDAMASAGIAIRSTLLPALESVLPKLTSLAESMTAARESGLGLFAAIGNASRNAFAGEPFEEIKHLKDEIASVQRARESLLKGGNVTAFFAPFGDEKEKLEALNKQLALASKNLEHFKRIQREQALKLGEGLGPDREGRGRERPDLAEAELLRRQKQAAARVKRFLQDEKPKKTRTGTDGADTARQEAAAQLAFDLAQIKKASDATIGAFANAEKIMQAMRSAGLVEDEKYYASKLGFIRFNSQEQEAALQKEIARLQRETFAGKTAAKDRLDNQGKIADAQAKIAKIRADAVVQIEINSIEQQAALKAIEQSYIDATTAAQAYLDTIRRQNAREIAGIGRGEKFRQNRRQTTGRAPAS